MGSVDGSVAKLWRHEFKKSGIEFDEIVLIGNNLGELDRPEFIPNVFQLIGIVRKIQEDQELKVSHERVPIGLPNLMSEKETMERREKTKVVRSESMSAMKSILK